MSYTISARGRSALHPDWRHPAGPETRLYSACRSGVEPGYGLQAPVGVSAGVSARRRLPSWLCPLRRVPLMMVLPGAVAERLAPWAP